MPSSTTLGGVSELPAEKSSHPLWVSAVTFFASSASTCW